MSLKPWPNIIGIGMDAISKKEKESNYSVAILM